MSVSLLHIYKMQVDMESTIHKISQLVEHSAVNRVVVGSSPTWGVKVNNLIQDL